MTLLEPRSVAVSHPPARIAGAAWSTVSLHLATFLAVAWIVGRQQPLSRDPSEGARPASQLLSFALPGLTGGDRGGEKTDQPPATVQRPGTARTTIPTRVVPSLTGTENPDPPTQEINVPALPEASGLREVPGVLTAVWVSNGISRGPGSNRGAEGGAGPGLGRGGGPGIGDGPGGPGTNVTPPQLISQVRPNYTSAALQARVRGTVALEAIVQADGSIGDIRILRSLDRTFGLDQEAIKAVRLWRFRPAMHAGKPIPMFVTIELTFELR